MCINTISIEFIAIFEKNAGKYLSLIYRDNDDDNDYDYPNNIFCSVKNNEYDLFNKLYEYQSFDSNKPLDIIIYPEDIFNKTYDDMFFQSEYLTDSDSSSSS